MEKSIKCLKEEISKLRGYAVIIDGEDGEWEPVTTVSVEDIYELINQLDKPEVLSQEWIDENKAYYGHWIPAVPIIHLKNLLVPKQEITEEEAWNKIAEYYPADRAGLQSILEHFYYGGFMTDVVAKKPVIPKFVAEYIEECKREDITLALSYDVGAFSEMGDWLYNEQKDDKNIELFARAWLDGYEIELEPKYCVKLPVDELYKKELYKHDGKFKIKCVSEGAIGDIRKKFTEQEIKEYDERYWAFAVKIEELEE